MSDIYLKNLSVQTVDNGYLVYGSLCNEVDGSEATSFEMVFTDRAELLKNIIHWVNTGEAA